MRFFHSGVVAYAWPVEPVDSGPDAVVVGLAAGTSGLVPVGYPDDTALLDDQARTAEFRHVARIWDTTHCLWVYLPDQWWGARLMWDAASGDFLCWYVDFLRPVQCHDTFVDTCDLSLDIVVLPDGTMFWKDEDRYAEKIGLGLIEDEERANVELARADVVAAIEARRFPFDGSYLDWRPDGLERTLPSDALQTS
jgi:protein associated with RNAse G/E